MSNESHELTIEDQLEIYKGRADYASQLLTLIVNKLGGEFELSIEDTEVDLSGVHVENMEDGGFRILVFKEENAD